jgi:hypothetical protein
MQRYHFIGTLRDESEVRLQWTGWLVCFSEFDQKVALIEGLRPYDGGSIKDLASWFEYRPTKPWSYGDGAIIEYEPPGWFERILSVSGLSWFLIPARRIAAGEKVPLEEITTAYSAASQGQPMPRGTIEELFAYAKQRGLLR